MGKQMMISLIVCFVGMTKVIATSQMVSVMQENTSDRE